jgi:hypothetical protein
MWLPNGHKTITKKVFEESGQNSNFTKDAQSYLVDRSPDMDFMQDQSTTIDAGIAPGVE